VNSGKAPLDPYADSFVLSHLGYWADNGSPYYHNEVAFNFSAGMEACAAARNCTLQDALLAVQADARSRAIPLRYFQWDDWAELSWDWPPPPSIFPDAAGHWLGPDPWAPQSEPRPMPLSLYIGHGDTRGCQICQKHNNCAACEAARRDYSWPEASQAVCADSRFFEGLMRNGSEAGMVHFEQDYLCASTAATSTDLETGAAWFKALDSAVAEAGIDLQLCMMTPAHALASTTMHRASNGRAASDHAGRRASDAPGETYPLGFSALLLSALGLWPSRDNVCEPPRYRCHLGCILLKMAAISVSTGTNSSPVGPPCWEDPCPAGTLVPEADPALQTALAVLLGGPCECRRSVSLSCFLADI